MKYPQYIADFMSTHGVDDSEIWQIHGTTWVVKHKALERIAALTGIVFDRPAVIENNAADKIAVMCVFGQLGDRTEWSIGECAPYNNKNQYPYAMAEKRGKDRVILKLLNAHGALYSEDEADDFKPNGNSVHATLPKKDARDIYTKMQSEIATWQTREQGKLWMEGNKDRIKVLPDDWQDILRLRCHEMLEDLRQREAV